MFNNKNIFISGGTGSFGNRFIEIVIKRYKPKKIIVFSRDEYKQYIMQKNTQKKNFLLWDFFWGT